MPGPLAVHLDGGASGRLHLQHGPIDLVIGVDDPGSDGSELRAHAFAAARARFATILEELVSELPLLKQGVRHEVLRPAGAVALRMHAAVLPFADDHFITPMAAVAGAVADEVLAAMLAAFAPEERPARIYVNDGGDIALHLGPGASHRVGIAREDGAALGRFEVRHGDGTGGIATSGRGGRSLSMGIADSVTVLARTAAAADAAATIIANAVDLPGHGAILRAPADTVVDDSDLGTRPVVVGVGDLTAEERAAALDAGARTANGLVGRGLIARAALFLGPDGRVV